jgi:hypothetical protein
MIGGDPHPCYLPARQVGHHTAPGPRAKTINGRAAAGRRGDGVEVDTVDDSRRHGASRGRDGLRHDTREGASSWSSSLPGR